MKRWMLVWLMLGGVVFGQVIPPGGGDVELPAGLVIGTNAGSSGYILKYKSGTPGDTFYAEWGPFVLPAPGPSSSTLEDIVGNGNTVTGRAVTIDAANRFTNTFGGVKTRLGVQIEGAYATASGEYSFSMGDGSQATGNDSFGVGDRCFADGAASVALGSKSRATNDGAFVWNMRLSDLYGSHGGGTFNINPDGGLSGVWVGETNLQEILDGRVSTNGGTVTGAILTTLDHVNNPPADNEFPNAGWVRGLAMAGAECYFTPTLTNGYGEKTTNFARLSETVPVAGFTNSIASPVPSDTYLVGGICTNMRTAVRSTITIDAWLARVGGTAASVIPLFAEIYYIYNGTTNQLGDWSVGPLQVTQTTPQNLKWVVAFSEPTVTGSVQIIGYLRSGTVSGPAAGLAVYGGGTLTSHMDIQSGASAYDLTAAKIAAAGGVTGGTFSVGTSVSNLNGVMYIPSNVFATAAHGIAGTNAQARVGILETNSVTPAQLTTATNATLIATTNRVAGVGYLLPASTQNLVTASQLTTATNATVIAATNRVAGVGYLLPISTQNLVNVTQLSSATNAAVIDATNRVAGMGYLLNAVVTRMVTYSTTNPVITLSESTNVWHWAPPTNVALSCTLSGPGAGWGGSGMLKLSRTNNIGSVTWPTNAFWAINGTRTTNAPTLANYNLIVVDYFNTSWTLGLITTNATEL